MHNLLNHRHLSSAAVLARTVTNMVSIAWAVVVLARDDALSITTLGPYMTAYINEDVWGWFFLIMPSILMYRLWWESKPNYWFTAGYAIQAFVWLYLCGYVVFTQWFSKPLIFAMVLVTAGIAQYAFVVMPRERRQNNVASPLCRRSYDLAGPNIASHDLQ